ncbi:unnamed protein product [Tetraodon nigroviridis]|uniref:(spotted green pufferfish) hypothetical protein n=1 Tax=Tetraodon nigroviridis TaxID=99883 RepID=Q4S7X9_TETNG|nr:unnamed protein product [Tetraodon nigroviridis]
MNEYERQEQELKQKNRQESLAYKNFWERQIEEKKLLKDLDKLQEKQLKERLNKFNELKQRRMREEPVTRQAMAYESLADVNIEQVLKSALRNEQIRVKAETAKREAEDSRRRQEDEIRAARNKRLSDHALQITQAKHSKTKRQLLKEKQEAWEKAAGWTPAIRPAAPAHGETRMPMALNRTHTQIKPRMNMDDFDTYFNMSVYNLHIPYRRH